MSFLTEDLLNKEDQKEINKCFAELYQIDQEAMKRYEGDMENEDETLSIIIKPEALDTSILEEDTNQNHLWRPSSWDEYIGQQKLKNVLQGYIKGTKELNRTFPHLMIDGKAGTGKTTIIYLIAKQLGIPFVECVTNTIQSPQQFVDKLAEAKGGILFLDEIQEINRKVANFVLPLLEDFQINGKKIKPFTFACATTEKGELLKKFKPFVDRMKIQKTLDPYTINELTILTKQYKEKTFPNKKIDESIYSKIANNCRGTPRIAIRWLESYIFMGCSVDEVFTSYNIIKDGITEDDIKVLKLLKEKEKGVGLKAICAFIGTSEANYLYQIEGYLIEKRLLTITNRRQITEEGKEFLKNLNI